MSYKSKNIRAAVKVFEYISRPNFFEGASQKYCESNQNWGSYGQKVITYFKEGSFP